MIANGFSFVFLGVVVEHNILFNLEDSHMYVVLSISFQTSIVQAFKIDVDTWKFSMLLLYIFWDDWPVFVISALN